MGGVAHELESAWAARWHRALDDEAAEIASLHLMAGEEKRALAALGLAIRGRTGVGPRAHAGLADCVAADRRQVGRALLVACSAGSARDRLLLATTAMGALRGAK